MNFDLDPQDEVFRAEVRAFVRENLPPDIARRGRHDYHSTRPDVQRWIRALNAKGWAAPHWPMPYGGQPWSGMQRFIYLEELRRARAPVLDRTGIDLLGPVLCAFGSDEQRAYYLPRILNGDDWWCQGFSEPGAGSDLAGLRTTAALEGDHYVVNGQKTWTSEAHWADRIFTLVRTDSTVKPQAGISFLLIDINTLGVTRRPIWTIDESLTLNEVFFDNVRVPVANLVGEPGKGWTYAKQLLTFERTTSAEIPHIKRDLMQLKHLAATTMKRGKPLSEDPLFAQELAELQIAVMALEWSVLRVLHTRGDAAQSAVASVLKLRGSELFQRVADMTAQALGDYSVAMVPDPEGLHVMRPDGLYPPLTDHEAIGAPSRSLFRRSVTIYGGTNEVQRNIIAKAILGL
jgi:alkylation response protein AidB-like acyl-CoA dehydrogenase